ncbi:GspE/PulE family protein [Tepidimonas charontis]|uniref:Type II secretion system protein E n=1 Tax=Tepidimonas charontis TaxID=2267262 RepID=A0A554XIY3_9BURK|nr:GspE/PulE family protein [Tepidimonas charontis]TSE35772.1 Type II secretion system protein E [Tepidimonas charontis]
MSVDSDNDSAPCPAAPAPASPLQPRTAAELWALLDRPQTRALTARHLGEALVQMGFLSEQQLREVLVTQHEQRHLGVDRQVGDWLIERGLVSETQLHQAIATWLGNHTVDPTHFAFDREAVALVPQALAQRESVVPLALRGDELAVLMADPLDQRLLEELRFLTQRRLRPVLAAPGTLPAALARAYETTPALSGLQPARHGEHVGAEANRRRLTAHDWLADLQQAAEVGAEQQTDVVSEADNTLVRLINSLIEEAIAQKASDIHIETEPPPKPVRVRLRIDGELKRYMEIDARFRYALVARIKIMAGMDISEHRKPQDGKIDFARFGGIKTELRVVTVPTTAGLEDVVLRLLAASKPMPLDGIGLSERDLADLRRMALKPYGLILVCGPTGSGKTTTLHSLIADINTEDRKIWTAEDPIEITQAGLRQVQINARIGWTFAAAMRTFLRADPDVIMIGEMRDEETARIAVEASLTGHLVLSTLHTNSAPESITRLLEIGIDPFNFSDSLLAILAQRLVRRLCKHCVQSRPATDDELEALATHYLSSSAEPGASLDVAGQIERWRAAYGVDVGARRVVRAYVKRGCEVCEGRGYKGRLGIYELMLCDDAIRHHIRHRSPAGDIRAAALAAGMHTLRQDGIEKVLAGLTDLSEVIAATNV